MLTAGLTGSLYDGVTVIGKLLTIQMAVGIDETER